MSIGRGLNPTKNHVVQDGNGSWSGCAFLPACNRFLPFRHLFALASSTLTNAAIWPGGLWNGATFKFLETLGKAKRRLAALFKRTHEVTN